ncbi:MAG: carboxypeptidase regulatory-like domain-containing protein, partial [Bryobacteraceae bacterium]
MTKGIEHAAFAGHAMREERCVLGGMLGVLTIAVSQTIAALKVIRAGMFVLILGALLLIGLSPQEASAQLATARVTGTVRDEQAAVVPQAKVTVTQTQTGYDAQATTNDAGQFNFPALPVGPYDIRVEAAGFRMYQRSGVVLTVGQELTVDVPLELGVADQVVNVEANAVAVDTTSATQQSTVEENVIRDLPLNGRNPAMLTYTVAGVTDTTQNDAGSTTAPAKALDATNPQQSAPSVHGSRPGGTYFSLDGANNTDPYTVIGGPFPNPDAVGEFSVVTGTYGAQYVSAPGGALNIVTKSGTNEVHGSAFEFIRNGYFNARNALSTTPDVLKRNQFGVAVGAPIIRNRLFVFGTYQATPTSDNLTKTGLFPTALEAQGNFGTFTIPSAMISPTNQKLLKYLPVGTSSSALTSYQSPQNSNDQQGLMKVDLDLGQHRVFARAFYDRYTLDPVGSNGPGGLASAHTGFIQPWLSLALGDTWTKGNWIFQSRASLIRQQATAFVASDNISYKSLGVTNVTDDNLHPAISTVGAFPGFQVGAGNNAEFPRKEVELSETVFASEGKHQLS